MLFQYWLSTVVVVEEVFVVEQQKLLIEETENRKLITDECFDFYSCIRREIIFSSMSSIFVYFAN